MLCFPSASKGAACPDPDGSGMNRRLSYSCGNQRPGRSDADPRLKTSAALVGVRGSGAILGQSVMSDILGRAAAAGNGKRRSVPTRPRRHRRESRRTAGMKTGRGGAAAIVSSCARGICHSSGSRVRLPRRRELRVMGEVVRQWVLELSGMTNPRFRRTHQSAVSRLPLRSQGNRSMSKRFLPSLREM